MNLSKVELYFSCTLLQNLIDVQEKRGKNILLIILVIDLINITEFFGTKPKCCKNFTSTIVDICLFCESKRWKRRKQNKRLLISNIWNFAASGSSWRVPLLRTFQQVPSGLENIFFFVKLPKNFHDKFCRNVLHCLLLFLRQFFSLSQILASGSSQKVVG